MAPLPYGNSRISRFNNELFNSLTSKNDQFIDQSEKMLLPVKKCLFVRLLNSIVHHRGLMNYKRDDTNIYLTLVNSLKNIMITIKLQSKPVK